VSLLRDLFRRALNFKSTLWIALFHFSIFFKASIQWIIGEKPKEMEELLHQCNLASSYYVFG
jgi:hypothetical protein